MTRVPQPKQQKTINTKITSTAMRLALAGSERVALDSSVTVTVLSSTSEFEASTTEVVVGLTTGL